jgi:choline dehydrogenase-like flavoprotein
MPPVTKHDAVVVDARVAGAATAMLLARAGCDVLVLDRSRYGPSPERFRCWFAMGHQHAEVEVQLRLRASGAVPDSGRSTDPAGVAGSVEVVLGETVAGSGRCCGEQVASGAGGSYSCSSGM